jgi:hypothetical protein
VVLAKPELSPAGGGEQPLRDIHGVLAIGATAWRRTRQENALTRD